jgi:dynein assembly factor 5
MCLHLFESLSFDKALLQPFVHSILKDIILSCCIWRAGKKPAVLRTYATQFLSLFLQLFSPLEAVPFLEPLFASDILPTLCSNVDDDEQTTRQHCLSTLIFVLEVPGIWNADAFKKLYPELLKRMDDAKDQVRIHTASVWAAFFPAVKTWMGSVALLKGPEDEGKLTTVKDGQVIELGLDRGHYETIIDGLLIHLDDPDQNVQEAVCLALLAGKQNVFDATLLHEKVHNAFGKHKSRLFLDRLIQ